MSIKEARRQIWFAHDRARLVDTPEFDDVLDRLVLEVQAAMPCYDTAKYGDYRITRCEGPSPVCESCAARDKLKEAACTTTTRTKA